MKRNYLYYLLTILLLAVSCEKDEMACTTAVETQEVSSIAATTAQCGGIISSDGNPTIKEAGVEWCTTSDFESNVSCASIAKAKLGKFACEITDLKDNTQYYVRAYARNSYGTIYGEVLSFKTLEIVLPAVLTDSVTNISPTSATVGGEVTDDGNGVVAECGVVYSTNPNPTIENNKVVCGSGKGTFTCNLSNLQEGTTYYVRAYAVNQKGTAYGEEQSFTTKYAFSVSSSKQVVFSSGNLQYTQSTNQWSFASAQYEVIGTDNVTGGNVSSNPFFGDMKEGTALADKIDLFGWSTGATNFGVSTSTDWENDYLGSFVDWGTNKIGNDAPNTWRTLSLDEWNYLLNTRPNASSLKGVAQINGVNGLILLPDNWTCPSGVTFKLGFHSEYSVEAYGQHQTFSADQWSKLESAGAVFLPAAGNRDGSNVYYVQYRGYCWSATENYVNRAYGIGFDSNEEFLSGYHRNYGQSVRLVKDLQ